MLYLELKLLNLVHINDLLKDESTFHKVLKKQEVFSTSVPFNDTLVQLKMSYEIDEKTVFDNWDDKPIVIDMEAYEVPAILRRALKLSKLQETGLIECFTDKCCPTKLLDLHSGKIFKRSQVFQAIKASKVIQIRF